MKTPPILLLLIALNATICFSQTVVNGYADLSEFDFKSERPVYLYGYWEFVTDSFLDPMDSVDIVERDTLFVPGSWTRIGFDVLGYGTYRVRMKLPPNHRELSLFIPIVNSAARIFINGKHISDIGRVGENTETHYPKFDGTICSLDGVGEDVEVMIHVSNFTYFSAGFPRAPYIQKTSSIIESLSRSNGIENFFAGSLVALFIYQLILFFLYRRGKPYLWLSLICLTVALRALIVHSGSFLLPKLLPDIHWEFWKKIEFGGVYATTALFPLYIYHLFKEQAPRWPIYIFVSIAVLLCGVTLITPQYIYGQLLDVCHVGLLFAFVYAVISISRAWRSGNEDARVILFGVLASFPFILLEILKNSALGIVFIQLNHLVEMGVLVFLLFQVYLLANHYSKSYSRLEQMNVELEHRINERTSELQTANTVKDRLLSVMSHDIKSPLNSLRGILQIYNQGGISLQEFNTFNRHIEGDLNRTNLLLENILYWTASQLKGITVKTQRFDLHKLIEENFQLFQTAVSDKKILLKQDVPVPFVIDSDRNIMNFVFRNLLANAIKFTFEGGKITIVARRSEDHASIEVVDNGIGMDEEALRKLFEADAMVSTYGTRNEKGTGLGLSLCREYLSEIQGKLEVSSEKGKGSSFKIVLPQELRSKPLREESFA